MEPSKEAINVRICRLGNQLWGKGAASLLGAESSGKRNLTREALLDALTVLYDECNKDVLKKNDDFVAKFIDKYRCILSELKQLRVNISDFEIKDLIGRGHFGEVHVVYEKHTGDVYAMKTLKKETTLKHLSIAFFEEERDIMALSRSDWLIKLQYAFQDTAQLYLIMEYCPGGDLAGLLDRMGKPLPENDAVFYLAEIIQALNDLHSLGFIHRDVKPDNILLDRCGHLKLGDFGSAARISSLNKIKASMPIGTTDYIAPEVLMGLENPKQICHSTPCDYWSMGIVAYELVTYCTPFKAADNKGVVHTYNSIIDHGKKKDSVPIKYPSDLQNNVSDELKDLIKNLLHPVPSKRPVYNDLIRYKVFAKTLWDSLRQQVPPFVPIITAQDDTSNFLELEKQNPTLSVDNFRIKANFSGKNLPFIGFTYTQDIGSSMPLETNGDIQDKDITIKDSITSNSSGEPSNGFLNSSMNGTAFCLSNIREMENLLESRKKEIDSLHKQLATLMSKQGFSEDKSKRLQDAENQRTQLEKNLTEMSCQNQKLQHQLEMEHKGRQVLETKSLQLIRSAKKRWKEKTDEQVAALNDKINEYETKSVEDDNKKRELQNQLSATSADLGKSLRELETLKKLQLTHKDSMAKARRLSRQSIVGLEQISQENNVQLQSLTQNLKKEIDLKNKIDAELKQYVNELKAAEERENNLLNLLRKDKDSYSKELLLLTNKYDEKCEEVSYLEIKLVDLEERNNKLEQVERQNTEKHTDLVKDLDKSQHSARSKIEHLEKKIKDLQSSIDSLEAMSKEKDEKNMILIKDKSNIEILLEKAVACEEKHRERVSVLEEMVGKLQENVTSLETLKQELSIQAAQAATNSKTTVDNSANSERVLVLQEQINKLEGQLRDTREECVLLKQEARKANSALWKKEKELSNCELDKRINTRELKQSEEKLNSLQEKLKDVISKHEIAAKELQTSLDGKCKEVESLEKSIKTLKSTVSDHENKLRNFENNFDKENKSNALSHQKLQLEAQSLKEKNEKLQSEIKICEERRSKVEELIEKCRIEVKNTEAQRAAEKEQRIRLEVTLNERNKDCDNIQQNYKMLKEACTMLEEQLIDFERVTEVLDSENTQLKAEITSLHSQIQKLNDDSSTGKKLLDIQKFNRVSAEVKIKELDEKLHEEQAKNTELEKQISNILNRESSLSTEVDQRGMEIVQMESALKQSTAELKALRTEVNALKEECTRLLTDGAALREDNMRIQLDLRESKENNAALHSLIVEREEELSAQQYHWQQREVKAEATISQHIKLIDFLQTKVEEAKRKKTFGEKLFRRPSAKENILPLTPQTPLNSKTSFVCEQSKELLKEKQKNRDLLDQLSTLQSRLKVIEGKPINDVTIAKEKEPLKSSEVLMDGGVKIHRGALLIRVQMKLYLDRIEWKSERDGSQGQFPFRGSPKLITNISSADSEILLSDTEKKFGIKICMTSDTTCWPSQSLLIVCSSAHQKDAWLSHLHKLPSLKLINTNEVCSSLSNYKPKPIIQFPRSIMEPNFVLQIEDDLLLIGADNGLFCYSPNAKKKEPIPLTGMSGFVRARSASKIDRFIALNTTGQLLHYSLRQLIALVKSLALSSIQPSVLPTFDCINIADPGDANDRDQCTMFEISQPSQSTDRNFLCVSTSSKFIIFGYDVLKMSFLPLRQIKTDSITCMKFTQHSVIVASHKFYEIDLKNYNVEEFLDPCDTSLSHAIFAHKKNIFPIAIIQIKNMEIDKAIEYLLCFSGFGIFVDEFGQRSRSEDIMWVNLPLQIIYRKPFLLVSHFASMEIIHLKTDSYNKRQGTDTDSIDSSVFDSSNNANDKIVLNFNSLRCLGKATSTGSIYIMQSLHKTDNHSLEILELNGNNAFKKHIGVSIETLDTIDDIDNCKELEENLDQISIPDNDSICTDSSIEVKTDFAAHIRERAKVINSLKNENKKVNSIQNIISRQNTVTNPDSSGDESDLSSSSGDNYDNSAKNASHIKKLYSSVNKNKPVNNETPVKTATDICNEMFLSKKQVRFN